MLLITKEAHYYLVVNRRVIYFINFEMGNHKNLLDEIMLY
jgi:hypothetical protein